MKHAAAPLAVLVLSTGLSACGGAPSPGTTVLEDAVGSQLVPQAGAAPVPAHSGELLRAGETVLAGTNYPRLLVDGRATVLAPGAAVEILGAGRQSLLRGQVVVTGSGGPPLTLLAGDAAVQPVPGGAVRVAREFAVRVAVYTGGALVTAGSRSSRVPALHEILVPGQALPGASSPLALADDRLDLAADPVLVREDRQLVAAAAAVDQEGAGQRAATQLQRTISHTVIPVVYTAALPGQPISERLLPYAIAAAGPGSLATRFEQARQLRSQGGSWGVVAALLNAHVSQVQATLSQVEDAAARPARARAVGTIPDATTVLAAGPGLSVTASGLLLAANAGGSSAGAYRPTRHRPVTASTSGPAPRGGSGASGSRSSGGASPSPAPSPAPSQGVVSTLLGVAGSLLTQAPVPTPAAGSAAGYIAHQSSTAQASTEKRTARTQERTAQASTEKRTARVEKRTGQAGESSERPSPRADRRGRVRSLLRALLG